MPLSVMVAFSIASVGVVYQIVDSFKDGLDSWPSIVISAGVGWLILSGFWKGHRLAWQWGRLIALFYGIYLAIVFLPEVVTAPALTVRLLMPAVPTAALILMGIVLGSRASRTYFRLVCPDCGSRHVKAADFTFEQAKCKRCGRIW